MTLFRAEFSRACFLFIFFMCALSGRTDPVLAETSSAEASPFGAFASNPDAPIQIEADTLDVEQGSQTATFAGNVVATQDTMVLKSDQLIVRYEEKNGERSQITRIDARGNVHISAEKGQSAKGDWAVYLTAPRDITMGGQVILHQGNNIIRGDRLVINLNTGKARITSAPSEKDRKTGGGNRVKGLFSAPDR